LRTAALLAVLWLWAVLLLFLYDVRGFRGAVANVFTVRVSVYEWRER
jgi:hypothetical protein